MATKKWIGGGPVRAQVNTFLFAGTWEADDLIRVISGSKQKDITAGSATTNTVVSNVDTAIDALDSTDFPEIKGSVNGVTATSSTGTLTLTANEPGVPFTISLTPLEANGGAADAQTIEGAGTVTTGTASVTNTGPHVWGTVNNWSDGVAPGAGDTLHFDNTDVDLLYDLSKAGATITAVYFWMTYTGRAGLPKYNSEDETFPEYRTDYVTADVTSLYIGKGEGQGSGRIKWNAGTVQTAVIVYDTGSPEEPDVPAFLWKGTNASNTFTAAGGSSGIAFFGGEVATVLTMVVEEPAEVTCGLGCTLGTITVNGGTLRLNASVGTVLNVYDGEVFVEGAATVAQLNIYGGTVRYNSTGTLGGNTIVADGGLLDFSQGVGAVAVTNAIDVYGVDCVNDPDKRVTTLVIDYNGVTPLGALGPNVRVTRGTPA